jgi:hypothetical protein
MHHRHNFALFFGGNVVSGVQYEMFVWGFRHIAAGKIPFATFDHRHQSAGFFGELSLGVFQCSSLYGFG